MVAAIRSLLHLGVFVTGVGVLLVIINNSFDWILYPIVLCRLGFFAGVITLALISIPFNQALVVGFNWVGREVVLFPWLWRGIRWLVTTMTKITTYLVEWLAATRFRPLITTVGCGVSFAKRLTNATIAAIIRGWRWAGRHVKFITFIGLSAWDPIPAMLFAQQVYKIRSTSLAYMGLFVLATVIANALWAIGITAGLETIQALDQEFLAFINWSEHWATWIVSFSGSAWKADFGFFMELIGTCKI